jgi:DNA-binding HxlR family transcriptional regulator
MRAGAQLLLMAANPANREILRSLLENPLELAPGRTYRVSDGGREMLDVGAVVERWLARAPGREMDYDSEPAQRAVVSLAEAWSATVVHMLAREPHTFDELYDAIPGLSRRALARHIGEMEAAGQLVAFPAGDGGAIYMLTDWMRSGIAPLIASARLERRNPMEGMAPIDALDVEAGFRLSLPLIELPEELRGSCRLGLNLCEEGEDYGEDGPPNELTGVTAQVEQGRVAACEAGLDKGSDAWAAGTANEWLDTVIEPDTKLVRTGGDAWLTGAVVRALHQTLFGHSTEPDPVDRERW